MKTEFVTISSTDDEASIARAAEILRRGGLVAFPTETVYGLGASALDADAVSRVFVAKGRPQDNPLIVHLADVADLDRYVTDVPPRARALMEKLCPTSMTVILKKKDCIPSVVSAGLDTIGVRIPNHDITRAIIRKAGVPVVGPSGNLSGKPSPTTAEHVYHDMNGRIDMIVDGGPCQVGLESTVIDFSGEYPTILRPGKLGVEFLRQYLPDIQVDPHVLDVALATGGPVRSPGMKYKHYAPNADVFVIEGSLANTRAEIERRIHVLCASGKKVGVLAQEKSFSPKGASTLYAGDSLNDYAAHLFSYLRQFDEMGVDVILAQFEPAGDISLAIKNRLYRSAANRIIHV